MDIKILSRMNYLRLIGASLVLATAVSPVSLAQTSPSSDPAEQLEEQTTTSPDGTSQTVAEPLEVDQQQADQFFQPAARPQIIERSSAPNSDREALIEPPPGSQTPAEVTPGQRLNLQIR